MINDKTDEVIVELFQSLLFKFQIELETSMRGSYFICDCLYLLYCKCHKINFKRDGSYIYSPDWIKNKKPTINCINKKDDKCFQYALTIVLHHEEIKIDL